MKVSERKDQSIKDQSYKYDLSTILNEEENGGQVVELHVRVYEDMQQITLSTQCYGTSTSGITLGTIDLEVLIDAATAMRDRFAR